MQPNLTTAAKPHDAPQFTLRQVAIWATLFSVALALLTQLGTWWGLILWLIAGVAVLAYPVYRTWYGFIPVAMVIAGAAILWLTPGIGHSPETNRRHECQYHLKHIGIALHNYHDRYGSFPPAYIADEKGRPMHSWRVLLLPFLEEGDLYKQYDFSEPWDGPNNSKLAAQIPRVYRCPSDSRSASPADTNYFAVLGDRSFWQGAKTVCMADVTDGLSNTLAVVESHGAGINWMEPRDLHILQMPAAINPLNGQGICSCHNQRDKGRGEFAHVLFADGSVHQLDNTTPPQTIEAMLTIAGGETFTFP